jgi:hypothetical protein
MKSTFFASFLFALTLLAFSPINAEPKVEQKAWTDPQTALAEDPDFGIQGEYGSAEAGAAVGVQVVALGNGKFDAYLLEGGLPGLGWEPGKKRTAMHGARENDKVVLQDDAKTSIATIELGKLSLRVAEGEPSILKRVDRHSPTLNAKPPEDAVILFDGKSADKWEKGAVKDGHLLATGCISKQLFSDYKLHLEFCIPYKPTARGQQRGNSGVYHSGRWETQILDSFGLDPKDNDCGGIYSISKPRFNMCLPPLTWQTYDVAFTAAKFDAEGKRTAWPRITVRLNGEAVHQDLELAKDFTTSAPMSVWLDNPEGPIFLQNHGNPVVFRNIWIVPHL